MTSVAMYRFFCTFLVHAIVFIIFHIGNFLSVNGSMFRAVKMNEFTLRARECQSKVFALLILGVWLRPRAVLDKG